MEKPSSKQYKTTNWSSYNAALKSRGDLMIWIDPHLKWQAEASGKRGRSLTYSNEAIELCLTMKCLFGLALRQAVGLVASLFRLANIDWTTPDFSTLCRRQKTLKVTIPTRKTQGALHLLVDSTGIKMLGEGEWKIKKHGSEYRRQWRKVHLGINAETLEIQAIEMTSNKTGDSPTLPALLDQIPEDTTIEAVYGDGAYDTRICHQAIAERQAYPVIPSRKNGRIWKDKTAGARARNEIIKATARLGRALWKQWSGYHKPKSGS